MHLGIKNIIGGSKKYLFGDGSYSQNIIQGGSVLQPQASYEFADPTNYYQDGVFSWVGPQHASYPMSNVIDGNVTTQGQLNQAAGNAMIWHFAQPRNIRRFGSRLASGTEGIYAGYIQYSDDGVAWSETNIAGSLDCRTTSLTYYAINDYGAHEWWRVYIPTSRYIQCSHVEWNERITLPSCIVITGAATVAPDPDTGASVFSCQNLVIDGGSLAPSTNSKGLIGVVSGSVRLVNGGRAHIDKLGKAGNFGNLTVLDLVPASLKRKLKNDLAAFVVLGEGADGAAGSGGYADGKPGVAASAMQTGGGGSGGLNGHNPSSSGAGGKGGPCCGGSGSPGIVSNNTTPYYAPAANPYGGPGLNASSDLPNCAAGGGTGDPVGAGANGGYTPTGGGGGLLMLFTPTLSIASGCIVSADGAAGVTGSNSYQTGSGGAGGGCVAVVTLPGGYTNAGTVRASGGAGTTGASHKNGGAGGAGSVNILTAS